MRYCQTLAASTLILIAMFGCTTPNKHASRDLYRNASYYDTVTDSNLDQMTSSQLDSYCFNYFMYSADVKKNSLESVRWKPLFISEVGITISKIDIDAYRYRKNDSVIDSDIPDRLEKVREELSQHKKDLDQIVASHGRCYGVGYKGKEYKKIIESSQKSIINLYERAERTKNEYMKSFQLVENRASLYEKNREFLTYDNDQIYLEIEHIDVKNMDKYYATTEISLVVQSKEKNKYLYPKNSEVWGYDVHPDLGGSFPVGASLTDVFGNSFKINKFTPEFYGNGKGIAPKQKLQFKLIFSNYPLEDSQYATLEFTEGTFGQKDNITLKLPIDLFTDDENIIKRIQKRN